VRVNAARFNLIAYSVAQAGRFAIMRKLGLVSRRIFKNRLHRHASKHRRSKVELSNCGDE
jgi:hypothetical protein